MKIEEIKTSKIKIFQNIRSDKKDVSDLMKSLERDGLLHPIGVYKKDDAYILAYGFRRLQAAKKLDWKTNPAVIVQEVFSEEDFLAKNTIENLHREEINPVELGRVCQLFTKNHDFSPSEIAAKLHISNKQVSVAMSIYKRLPKEYRDVIGFVPRGKAGKGKIPAAVAVAILKLALTPANTKKFLDFAKIHELTTREVHLIEKLSRIGLSLEEILENLDDYAIKNVVIAINIAEWKKLNYDGPFGNYTKEIVRGNEPPNKKLLI